MLTKCSRFTEHRIVLTTTKVPVQLRVRLYTTLVVSTMVYGSSAWLLTDNLKKSLFGVNSKMLSMISRRTIHEEAREPTFNIVEHVLCRRRSYLGHILRLDDNRTDRKLLLELSPREAPFVLGSLLDDTEYTNIPDMITAASDRDRWRTLWFLYEIVVSPLGECYVHDMTWDELLAIENKCRIHDRSI